MFIWKLCREKSSFLLLKKYRILRTMKWVKYFFWGVGGVISFLCPLPPKILGNGKLRRLKGGGSGTSMVALQHRRMNRPMFC